MAKYSSYSRAPRPKNRFREIYPIWRGIGCVMMILIPILAYAGAVLLVRENLAQGWLAVPPEFTRTVTLPFFGSISYLFANLVVAVLLAAAGFILLVVVYSLLYSLVGPSRYGPQDAPPEWGRRRGRRR